ncbi:MAG: DUF697 domain-containing protein [Desulfobacterales bacterium]|nr:DUF697 domain-containing protein [Desulfobacterales bacterium]
MEELKENTNSTTLPAEDEAEQIIKNHVYTAMGVGLVPVPIVDWVAMIGVQLNMLRKLAKAYNVPFLQDKVKNLVTSLVGGTFPVSIAAPFASLLKFIPVIGTTTGALSMSIIGGATTYAVGKVFNQHFASGGTFLTFDPKAVKEYYNKMFQEGKEIVTKLKEDDK